MRSHLYTLRQILSTNGTMLAAWHDLQLPETRVSAGDQLDGAMLWLCRAQDAARGGGISYGFALNGGWLPPYPETTGYIIPTFLRYAQRLEGQGQTKRPASMRDRALEMARWLCSVQLECGAIPGGTLGREPAPTIFNTGQVLQGWCGAYRETRDESLRLPLIRAAEWLASAQDDDGCWRRWMSPLTLQTPATYNVRSASALLEAGELLDDSKLKKAAIKNFDWALSQQTEEGWFDNNCLTDTVRPLTHTIGYTLEGLFDAAERLQEERYLAAVLRASNNLIGAVHDDGFLSGRFDKGWRPQVSWNCLTGSCQIALVWFRLSNLTGETRYRDEAEKLLGFVKRTQKLGKSANGNGHSSSFCGGVIGGIKGSHPVWGGYDPFRYPNWAAKFFADALLASSFNQ